LRIPTPLIEYALILPMLIVFAGAVISVGFEAFISNKNRRQAQIFLTISTLALALASLVIIGNTFSRSLAVEGTIAFDGPGVFMQFVILLTSILATMIMAERKVDPAGDAFAARSSAVAGGQDEAIVTKMGLVQTEVWPLLLFSVSGMLLFVSANDFLVLFVGLEVMSLPLYLLAAMARRKRLLSQEAALKYFLLGAFASAILLFGIALTYAYTGELNFGAVSAGISANNNAAGLLTAAVALVAVGLLFKVGAVPFHQWVPDVYTGSATVVTAFMASAVKVAAIGGSLRAFFVAFGGYAWDWRPMFWAVSILTMIVGSIVALSQIDVKRMLAYSSVANGGFILIGFASSSRAGTAAILFYLLTYSLATLGAFALVSLVRDPSGESNNITRWKGLGKKSPLVAGLFGFYLLSFAGIPLTSGFVAKFTLFVAAVSGGALPLVLVGVVASVIAAFFYIRIIILMFFSDPDPDGPVVVVPSKITAGAIAFTSVASAVLGVFPQWVIDYASSVSVFLR
jgi:NADH-quinone oxidoreductase subunit N